MTFLRMTPLGPGADGQPYDATSRLSENKRGGRLAAAGPCSLFWNLSAAAADQHAVTVEILTCPGFAAVLVYVNWQFAGVAAAVA